MLLTTSKHCLTSSSDSLETSSSWVGLQSQQLPWGDLQGWQLVQCVTLPMCPSNTMLRKLLTPLQINTVCSSCLCILFVVLPCGWLYMASHSLKWLGNSQHHLTLACTSCEVCLVPPQIQPKGDGGPEIPSAILQGPQKPHTPLTYMATAATGSASFPWFVLLF